MSSLLFSFRNELFSHNYFWNSDNVVALEPLSHLETLVLGGNRIRRFEDLQPLVKLRNLHTLELLGNPVCSLAGYPNIVLSMLPALLNLDGR